MYLEISFHLSEPSDRWKSFYSNGPCLLSSTDFFWTVPDVSLAALKLKNVLVLFYIDHTQIVG